MAKRAHRRMRAGAVKEASIPFRAAAAPSADPLVARVRAWLERKQVAEALVHEWQRLETKLYRQHGAISAREAVKRGHAEGRRMLALEARFRVAWKELDRDAGRLARARAKTV